VKEMLDMVCDAGLRALIMGKARQRVNSEGWLQICVLPL
jgi:hypothetical protein